MINKLRKRFIIISSAVVSVVLLLIFGVANLISYAKITDGSDQVLTSLAENGGTFKDFSMVIRPKDDKGNFTITKETPFETRYFTVTYDIVNDRTLQIKDVDCSCIASVSPNEAVAYANSVVVKPKESGNVEDYRYLVYDTDGGIMVIFMDNSRQLNTFRQFMSISGAIAGGSILIIVLLLCLLSRRIIAPIAASYEKQKQFITDASHELKTPLAIISANNELIEMECGESDCTRAIGKQVSRMATMTKNLTALAKIDETASLDQRTEFDLSRLVEECVEPYVAAAETKNMRLDTDVQQGVSFFGNDTLISQLMTMLMDNAVKYGRDYIRLTLTKNKRQINISVKNGADNIGEGNLDKYFERFYRSDESRAQGIEGSGIGLSIAKEIVELHKGKITAEGKDGEFEISIQL